MSLLRLVSTSVRVVALSIVLAAPGCANGALISAGDSLLQLEDQGNAAFRQGDFTSARVAWQNGLQSARRQERNTDAARFLFRLCTADEAAGAYQRALLEAQEALKIAMDTRNPALNAGARNCLSLVYRRLADYARASSNAEAALESALETGDLPMQAESLRNIGAVRQVTGKQAEALTFYERSLQAARTASDSLEEAKTLNDLAGLYRIRGQYAQSLKLYEESLTLRERLGDTRGRARVLANICSAYQNLVNYERAADACNRALELARGVRDRAAEGAALNTLAAVYHAQGRLRDALAAWQQSQVLRHDTGDVAGEARVWNNLGRLRSQLGEDDEALANFNQSLRIRESIGDLSGIAITHLNMGIHYLERARSDEALAHFNAALLPQPGNEQPELLWRAFDGLSRAYKLSGANALSILFGKQAVNEIQSIRRGLASMDEELQRSFIGDKVKVYRRLAGTLIDAGRLAEARQVLDMLKEEEHFDFVRRDTANDPRATRSSLNTSETEWNAQYQERTRTIAAKGAELAALRKKVNAGTADEADIARQRLLEGELQQSRIAFDKYLQQLKESFAKTERAIEFGEKDFKSLYALRGTLEKLGHGAVLVHYLITENALHIILTGPDSSVPPVHRQANVGGVALSRMINEYLLKLGSRGADPGREAQALYQVLIAPIDKDLEEYHAGTLMVSLDGPLRYLPLAALHDGSRYVVERFAVALYTVVAKDRLTAAPRPDLRVAGLGMSQAAGGFTALPAVAAELGGIVKENDADSDGILPGKLYLDADFTAKNLKDVLDAQLANGARSYPIIHFASHFKFTPGNEEDSFLLIGGGARLTLADLRDDNFNGVELLTLSACQTAVGGGADADGREIEGLGASAQSKGAGAVLATLWSVADRSTALLMINFYRELREGKSTKAEALRRAQLALLNGGQNASAERDSGRGNVLRPDTARPDPGDSVENPYRHPYFWGPFILMGNWL